MKVYGVRLDEIDNSTVQQRLYTKQRQAREAAIEFMKSDHPGYKLSAYAWVEHVVDFNESNRAIYTWTCRSYSVSVVEFELAD